MGRDELHVPAMSAGRSRNEILKTGRLTPSLKPTAEAF